MRYTLGVLGSTASGHRQTIPALYHPGAPSDPWPHGPVATDPQNLQYREHQLAALMQVGLSEERATAEFARIAAGDVWGG